MNKQDEGPIMNKQDEVTGNPVNKPLLGLVMIVRNESKRISEVLASYLGHIDSYTILDTGSVDGTQELIRKELSGIPGTLHEEPFIDFATSRNRALELHGTSTVFSMMPNGDVLFGGPALRAFLEANRHGPAGAYRVRISPGHYYHPLVMRTGAGWHYKWRTHECAMGPNVGDMIPGVIVSRDRGTRTDEEWRARWTRDLDLLNRDRMEDPKDPRPYFYLGQTHECLGQYELALTFFEGRTELGGYFDEVYEAKFRVGKMKAKLNRPWTEIQQAYFEAYAHDPRRAEPLYAISEHWYDKSQHHIALIFAAAAAEMPKAPTDLFLDEEIYSWKAADRAAISSFYAGRKDDGRRWAEKAVRARPDDERIRANRAFYAQGARELFGATVREIDFVPESGWNASNPSIYCEGGRVRCVVRTVNYAIVDGSYVTPPDDVVREESRYNGWQVIRTRNFLLDLSDDLSTTGAVELIDKTSGTRSNYPVHGFEDARLFYWQGSWHATATVCDFTEEGQREIAILDIDDDGSIVRAQPLRGPWSGQAQKNWMPLVDEDNLKFVYAAEPTTIFSLNDGHVIDFPADCTFGHGRLRGGSQGVKVDGSWIFVVHDVAFPGSGRFYLHRFVLLDEQLQLVSMTDLFHFDGLGIEFCAGLAKVNGKLVASYAVNDGSAKLAIFEWEAVRKALRKDFVI
jgi:tetratricopeptide (TPR) repeat protein